MPLELSTLGIKRLSDARKSRRMTQQDLANAAKVSLRTIQDLEKGRRTTVYDTTLVLIAKALELEMDQLLVSLTPATEIPSEVTAAESIKKTERRSTPHALKIIIGIIFLVAGIVAFLNVKGRKNDQLRVEVVKPTDGLVQARFNYRTTQSADWGSYWAQKGSGVCFNSLEFPRGVAARDTVEGTFSWSFHYPTNRPGVYVNLFREWAQEEEISLFSGAVTGDSSLAQSFRIMAPAMPGLYRIRAYIAPLVSPVVNYIGTQIKGQMVSNHLPQYVEAKLVVLPRSVMNKVVNE